MPLGLHGESCSRHASLLAGDRPVSDDRQVQHLARALGLTSKLGRDAAMQWCTVLVPVPCQTHLTDSGKS